MMFVRAIHIAKGAAIATALSLFLLLFSVNSSHAVLVDDIITLDEPAAIADIVMEGDGGIQTKLSDYRGQHLLLNIWATWCPPCVVELPKLDALQQRYADRGFKVIALSEDAGGIELVKRFYAKKNVALAPYADPNGAGFQALGVSRLPTSYLINPQGQVVSIVVGDIDWLGDTNIQQLERFLQAKP